MNRLDVIRRWQLEFERHRELPQGATPRMHWLWDMRRRLFRFLLASYGSAAWRPNQQDVQPGETQPPTAVVLADDIVRGKPPKSPARILKALKGIQRASDDPCRPGPLARGLGKNDWIVVGTLRRSSSLFFQSLRRHDIPCQSFRRKHAVVVSVRNCDYGLARELLERLPGGDARVRRSLRALQDASRPTCETPSRTMKSGTLAVLNGVISTLLPLSGLAAGAAFEAGAEGYIPPGVAVFSGMLCGMLSWGVWEWAFCRATAALHRRDRQEAHPSEPGDEFDDAPPLDRSPAVR